MPVSPTMLIRISRLTDGENKPLYAVWVRGICGVHFLEEVPRCRVGPKFLDRTTPGWDYFLDSIACNLGFLPSEFVEIDGEPWPPAALGDEPARCQLGADLAQRALAARAVVAQPACKRDHLGARLGERRHAPALARCCPLAVARGLELGDKRGFLELRDRAEHLAHQYRGRGVFRGKVRRGRRDWPELPLLPNTKRATRNNAAAARA